MDSLKNSKEFKHVLDKGHKFINGPFVFFAIKNNSDISRLGLIVTKKIGNAVRRNLIKRRLRSIFFSLSLESNYDIVIIARHKILEYKFSILKEKFDNIVSKLRQK